MCFTKLVEIILVISTNKCNLNKYDLRFYKLELLYKIDKLSKNSGIYEFHQRIQSWLLRNQ